MELQVAGRGRIAFNDISGAPCSSWGVFVTYGTRVYTYYYEGAGQFTVSIATNGDLTLTTSNGRSFRRCRASAPSRLAVIQGL